MKDNNQNNNNPNNNRPFANKPKSLGQVPFLLAPDIAPGAIRQQHLVSNPVAKGDTYHGGASTNFDRLAIGTSYQFMVVVSGVPAWITFPRSGTAANRPTSGRFTGDQYLATDTFAFSVWTGAAWKSVTLA